MSGNAILCYLCLWSHGSLSVQSLVGGVVPGSTGLSGQQMLFFIWVCQLLLPPAPPSTSSPTSVPEPSLVVGSKHAHLYWSVADGSSQGADITGSWWIPRWCGRWMAHLSISAPYFVSVLPLDKNFYKYICLKCVENILIVLHSKNISEVYCFKTKDYFILNYTY